MNGPRRSIVLKSHYYRQGVGGKLRRFARLTLSCGHVVERNVVNCPGYFARCVFCGEEEAKFVDAALEALGPL